MIGIKMIGIKMIESKEEKVEIRLTFGLFRVKISEKHPFKAP